METEDEEYLETFLLEDYKVKVQYLSAHLGRMWTRFNFLLTLNSALFAFSVQKGTIAFTSLFVPAGIVLSVVWYIFGANDNYLVEIYRQQIERSYDLLKQHVNNQGSKNGESLQQLPYAGFASTELPQERLGFLRWRLKGAKYSTSPHYMAAIMPVMFFLLWFLVWTTQLNPLF